MTTFFDWFTITISAFFWVKNIRRISEGTRYLIYLIFFMFYVFPLYLDYFVAMPDYTYTYKYVGYVASRKDVLTNITYDILLLVSQAIILYYKKGKSKIEYSSNGFNIKGSFYRIVLFIGMTSPSLFVIVLLREPAMLYTFQWREFDLFSAEGSYGHIERLTYVAISCSALLLFSKIKTSRILDVIFKIFVLFFVYSNVCIQGKRGMLLFAVVNFFVILFFKVFLNNRQKVVDKKKMFLGTVLGVIAVVSMLASTYFVKIGRGYSTDLADIMYVSTRVDFLRDDRVRMAIYSEENPEKMQILAYPCQTLLTDILTIVPIDYIAHYLTGFENKYSYQQFFTHAMEGNNYSHSFNSKEYSYETVTIFAELISNLGIFLGTFLMVVLCFWVYRLSDSYPYPYNILILCSFFLLNLYHIGYIIYYLEATFILCYLFNRKNRKREYIKN